MYILTVIFNWYWETEYQEKPTYLVYLATEEHKEGLIMTTKTPREPNHDNKNTKRA
jgi:hypothetical protein